MELNADIILKLYFIGHQKVTDVTTVIFKGSVFENCLIIVKFDKRTRIHHKQLKIGTANFIITI